MITRSNPRAGPTHPEANTRELLWTRVGVGLLAALAIVAAIGWITLTLEGWLSGTAWPHGPTVTLETLVTVLLGSADPQITATVGSTWRVATIALVNTTATTGMAVWALTWWFDWREGWRHRQRLRERTGSHTWARRRQLKPLLADPPRATSPEPAANGRLLVGMFRGRDLVVPARTSVMVVAPTRTGKSTRLVVPNLLRWDGPAVCTSVKRDVHDVTAARRRQVGPVAVFDPTGSTRLDSVRWSPLLTSTTFPDATKTATWLTDAASVEDKQESAKFWETLASKLLSPMLFAAANTGRTMHDVSHWVDRSAFDEVAVVLVGLGDDDAMAAWDAIRGLPDETRGSVFGTAMAIFRAFGSPRVRTRTSCTPTDTHNTLAVARMIRDNGTLYLVSPEHEQAELRPVFVALVQHVYRTAVEISAGLLGGGPLNPALLMLLDEAGNIAPPKNLPQIASTGAGQGITLMTIWQDRAQIRELYGDSEKTVISNHSTSVWLPGSQDLDTLKLLSDLIGEQWVSATNISSAADGAVSVSEGSERIDVAPPSFLRTLPHGKAVVITGNLPPALADTHAYYEQTRWRRLVGTAEVKRQAAMHDGTGATTAQHWNRARKEADLPRPGHTDVGDTQPDPTASDGGHPQAGLTRLLGATYPHEPGDQAALTRWEALAPALPTELHRRPNDTWQMVTLPAELANQISARPGPVDLSDPALRRELLPVWVAVGPADLLADTVSWEQLVAEWPLLDIHEVIRAAWEEVYPGLVDDVGLDDDVGSAHAS